MHAPKMQSRMTSVFSTARRKATSCASGAIGKLDEVEGGGAIKGRSRFSHCFLRRCASAVKAHQLPDLEFCRRRRRERTAKISPFDS